MTYRSVMVIMLALGSTTLSGNTLQNDYLNDTISEVIHAITKEAYYPIDVRQASIKALDTFSRQVDEYTRFLGPKEYNELLSTVGGDYYGIGIELGPKKNDEEFLMILQAKDGGPAQKAGIKRYDKIIAIDGVPVGTHTIEDNLKKIRGATRYSTVKLTVMRDTRIKTIEVKRDRMDTKTSWCAYLPQQKIIYCHISFFSHQVASQVQQALESGLKKKPRGIILDLRDNTGGVLRAAVDCASLFLPKKSLIVSTKNRNGKVVDRFHTTTKPIVPKQIPVIMLVNQYTASSAEILAKALSVHSQKLSASPYFYIVGTQTYGKGSVQDVRPIGSQCALKMTTALYYLADDTAIQNKGVIPDIHIKQKYPASKEVKLLNKLYSQSKKVKPYTTPILDHDALRLKALTKDYQITCACNLIMLLDHAKINTPHKVATHAKGLRWLQEQFVVPKSMKAEVLG